MVDGYKFYKGDEDIVVVERMEFASSIFNEQYRQALQQLNNMIGAPKEDIPSVLAFCGDRGEGKTSCMESVRNMLMNREQEAVKSYWGNNYPYLSESSFAFIKTIDPAFFDYNHNVLELILGRMFSEFDKEENIHREGQTKKERDEASKKLQRSFYDAKRCLTLMERALKPGYDPIEELDELSAGVSLAEKMNELIDNYLAFLYPNTDASKRFLIISIDDLDLNVKGAYEMAEQIRKYLVSKHCIVLISLKVEQLIEVISNYLDKQSAPEKNLDTPAMASKYLTKLIPMTNRVVMPKVYDLCNSKLTVYEDQREVHFFNSIKEAVVQLIYLKTRFLFYNSKGRVSPIVPNNLRSLRHLIGMLLDMSDFVNNNTSIANKNAFKAYFYHTWTRQLTEENAKTAQLLTGNTNTSELNKLVVMQLSRYIDRSQATELVKNIINANNYIYNVSIGDVFYLINFLEMSNVDEDLKQLLFFIRSYYSIRLYECYDVITEQEGELYPEPTLEGEVYKSDGWFKRTNQLQRLVNGSFFTYLPDDMLPMTKVDGDDFYRDLRIYSAITPLYKDTIKQLWSNITAYDVLTDEEKADIRTHFRVAEFLALTTKKSVRQKEADRYVNVKRDFPEPYYLTNYNRSTGYLVFDVMAPFYNVVNLKYAYGRFSYLKSRSGNPTDFYQFALTHDWSLLRRMMDFVRLKEYNEENPDTPQKIENLEPLKDEDINGGLLRLISNATIRNGDVLLAMMENLTSMRADNHNIRDHISCLENFYHDIINSEMRTYTNSSNNRPYVIRFAFLEAMIELMGNNKERQLLKSIYSTGINKKGYSGDEVLARFPRFFNLFDKSKKNTAIIEDMHKTYPKESARLSEAQWKSLFPENKQYKREQIISILGKAMSDMVGAEDDYDEDELTF